MRHSIIIFSLLIASTTVNSQTKNGTFSVTDGIKCTRTVTYKNKVSISLKGNTRIIVSNAIPAHKVGAFPNSGNPNTINEQDKKYSIPLHPKKANKLTSVSADGFGKGFPAYEFGVALNGVKLEPTAAEFFGGRTENMNPEWTLEALSTAVNLGDDCNNAHVQPTGEYHYHGTPWEYIKSVNGKSMSQVGWAADGFPIYYKYGYKDPLDTNSEIVSLISSYQLKQGTRPGDGIKAPNGTYDGTYVRDFEFIKGLGDLDIANGRFGITPEFPKGTYYYVITDDFPSLPRYFVGTPSEDFAVGGGILGNGGRRMARNRFGNNRGNRRQSPPNPAELMKMMDKNKDGKISKSEAKGPLQDQFDKIDSNNDNYISITELNKAPRPNQRNRRARR